MQDCDLHTVLRLPRGTFTPYSQGVKANVIFFQKGRPTEHVWIFDARSNVPGITKKDRPLTRAALRRVREVLRRRPERPEQTQRPRRDAAASAASTSARSRSAATSSTSPGSRTNRSKTATNCPNRRTSPPKPSPNSKPSWTTCAKSSRSWRRRRRSRNERRATGEMDFGQIGRSRLHCGTDRMARTETFRIHPEWTSIPRS